MAYTKFYFYTTTRYTEIAAKLRELKPQLKTHLLVLRNSDRKEMDRVQISDKEYGESGNKYASYTHSVDNDREIQDAINVLNTEMNEYRIEYNNTITDILLKDIAKELSIDYETVFTIVKVVLNRNIYTHFFSDFSELADFDSEDKATYTDFDKFYSNEYDICESIARKTLELVQNELELLRLKI